MRCDDCGCGFKPKFSSKGCKTQCGNCGNILDFDKFLPVKVFNNVLVLLPLLLTFNIVWALESYFDISSWVIRISAIIVMFMVFKPIQEGVVCFFYKQRNKQKD